MAADRKWCPRALSKKGNITQQQADKIVRDYRAANGQPKARKPR